MIMQLRGAFGRRARRKAADAAVARGMAEVLTALGNIVDDDAALGHIYAAAGAAITVDRIARPAASRRRLALRSLVTVAATLAAGSVALAVVVLPGASGTSADTAYVVRRIDSALDAADPGAIARMMVTTSGAAIPGDFTARTTAEEWSYGDQWRAVTYSAAGQLLYDEGFSTGSVYTLISYPARTWADQHEVSGPPRLTPDSGGCQPVIATLPLFPSGLPVVDFAAGSAPETVARALRTAVSCGSLVATGRQRIDGIDAIKLTSKSGSPIDESIWVSPATYLPVRVVARSDPGTAGQWQTADITWLRPTARNLARLSVGVPSGFHQVPFAPGTTPFMQNIAG
jgi:hypothetical protein